MAGALHHIPFVGREHELTTLGARLAAARDDAGSIVLVAGEPGIGKTRLTEEFATAAAARGTRVLWGRCYEGEGAPAYWPWVQVLRSLLRACDAPTLHNAIGPHDSILAHLVPELHDILPDLTAPPSLDAAQARFHLFDRVVALLRTIAGRMPLLVVLDDLHWADAPSLILLRFLGREISQMPLVLVGTFRAREARPPHPLAETLAELARDPRVERVTLSGLAEADIRHVLSRATGGEPSVHLVRTMAGRTDGNPYFIAELLRLLTGEGRFGAPDDRQPGWLQEAIPPGVQDVIRQRVGRLSPACQRALRAAAVLGREFDLDAVASVAEPIEEPLLEALEEAETAGLIAAVAADVGRYRFVHALVRETLYAAIPNLRRIRLHRFAGETLAALYRPNLQPHLAEIAYHFAEAAAGGDVPLAVEYCRRAGEAALALLAYEEAATHFTRALMLAKRGAITAPLLHCELHLALGDAQSRAGERAAAQAAFMQAARQARDLGATHHLARAALGYGDGGVQTGLVDEPLIALLEEALATLGDEESALRVRSLARLAMEWYWSDAHERRITLSGEAVELGRRVGDAGALAFALSAQHLALWEPENVAQRLAIGGEHQRAAEAAGDRQMLIEGYARRIPDLLQVGDIAAVEQAVARHGRLVAELRQPNYQWEALRFNGLLAHLHGRFAEMEELAREALTLAERAQIGGADVAYVSQLQFLRREQGRYAEMEAPMIDLMTRYPLLRDGWRNTLANLYAQTGRTDEAQREIDALASTGFDAVGRNLPTLGIMALLTEAIATVGDAGAAAVLYERLRPYEDHYIVNAMSPNFYGAAAHFLGMLAATMGRWEEAVAHFESALLRNTRTRVPSHIAATQFEYAKALLATQRAPERAGGRRAHELLDAALRSARALDMRRLVEQIEQLLRSSRPPRSLRSGITVQATHQGDGLTPRETEVLRLVARGMSNREIAAALVVTVNTVEVHLTRIYDKLSVRGRSAATAYALRHGLD